MYLLLCNFLKKLHLQKRKKKEKLNQTSTRWALCCISKGDGSKWHRKDRGWWDGIIPTFD